MLSTSEIVKKYNLAGRSELGQNFLLRNDILEKIVVSAGDLAGTDVLEIGPGPGGLTRAILESNPRRLVAVELDQCLVDVLNTEMRPFFNNLEIISGDALKINENELFSDRFRIVANLPYNIGTT
ncbi:MAG: 16S rRNA (adenine(1518)-N(6)/adenine(1519)-N(6))-dimethyltransferase RsmA, partial [Rickettsiales bacterium]|nr:16S rRNA (adenine(1518)-N(6)/adenine(1519)-N(6))-dimethyltransferase RsmA [Rickettsiales bacterium]